MPIIYKNNNKHIMKTLNEMSQTEAIEYIRIKNISPLTGYFQNERIAMVKFVKDYIDPKQTGCETCGSTVTEAKTKFVRFYLDNKDAIHLIAEGNVEVIELTEEPITSIEVAKIASEVIKPKNKNKKK